MPDRHHHHHYHHHHWRGRKGYAYHAGEPGPGPNRHRLYRNPSGGVIFGVCAGVANYYGWRDANALRVAWALLAIFMFPLPVIAYFVAAFLMKRAPGAPAYQSAEEERFWRTFSTRPKATFSELKHRFRALDARLASLERAVTSDEYGLKKAFRDLEKGA